MLSLESGKEAIVRLQVSVLILGVFRLLSLAEILGVWQLLSCNTGSLHS